MDDNVLILGQVMNKGQAKIEVVRILSLTQLLTTEEVKRPLGQDDKNYPIEYRNLMLLESRNTPARTYRKNRSKLSTCPKGGF